MAYDMAFNRLWFEAGVTFGFVETHIMEHGLYLLEGRGIYYLNNEYVEMQADDYLYMYPFVPQSFAATGWTEGRFDHFGTSALTVGNRGWSPSDAFRNYHVPKPGYRVNHTASWGLSVQLLQYLQCLGRRDYKGNLAYDSGFTRSIGNRNLRSCSVYDPAEITRVYLRDRNETIRVDRLVKGM
jgi:hypothetical protein